MNWSKISQISTTELLWQWLSRGTIQALLPELTIWGSSFFFSLHDDLLNATTSQSCKIGSHCSKSWPFVHMLVCKLSHVQLFATPWTVAHQAPLSLGFSRQEDWSGFPFASAASSWSRNWTHVSCIGQWILYQPSHRGSPSYIWQCL